jgi:hypothetical protein
MTGYGTILVPFSRQKRMAAVMENGSGLERMAAVLKKWQPS